MTTTDPSAACISALVAYLESEFAASGDLTDSHVVDEWPEPTEDLRLSPTRVVVAVIRAGKASSPERIGDPYVSKVTPGSSPVGTVRYCYGTIDQPLTIGLWASSRTLRDDVDAMLFGSLNRPMWDTVSPVANTTLAAAITKTGEQWIEPASMQDIWPGITLTIDGGDRIVVKDIRGDVFLASPRALHPALVPLVEVAGRRENSAAGLTLRCPDHFSNLCAFTFDDSPQTLDDAEGGRGSQRQEWRSLRSGSALIRWSRDVGGVVLQKRLFVDDGDRILTVFD